MILPLPKLSAAFYPVHHHLHLDILSSWSFQNFTNFWLSFCLTSSHSPMLISSLLPKLLMLEYPRDQLLRLLIYSIYTNSLGDLIQVKDLNTIHLLMASKHRVLIQTSVEICVSKSLHIISCSMSHRHQKLKISKAKLLLYSLITQLLHNVISILPFPHAKRFCSHSTFLAHRVPSMRNLCRLPL